MWLRSGQHPFTEHLLYARPCVFSKHESSSEITKMEYAPQASSILSTRLPYKAAGYEHKDITQTCLLFFPVVSLSGSQLNYCMWSSQIPPGIYKSTYVVSPAKQGIFRGHCDYVQFLPEVLTSLLTRTAHQVPPHSLGGACTLIALCSPLLQD